MKVLAQHKRRAHVNLQPRQHLRSLLGVEVVRQVSLLDLAPYVFECVFPLHGQGELPPLERCDGLRSVGPMSIPCLKREDLDRQSRTRTWRRHFSGHSRRRVPASGRAYRATTWWACLAHLKRKFRGGAGGMGLTRRRRLLAIPSRKVTVKTSIHREVLDACASYWSVIQNARSGAWTCRSRVG